MVNTKLLPFDLSLEQFRTLAINVLSSFGVPFERPLETSRIEEHPDSDPETIETTMWTSGSARISIVKLADRHVAMESTDRSCFGTLEGLRGDVVLRVNGNWIHRLGSYVLSGGDEDAIAVVEREWIRAIAEFAKSRVVIESDPLLPESWQTHFAHLPVAAPHTIAINIRYGVRYWQIHDTISPFGVWVVGDPSCEIPGARLRPIGPLPTRLAGVVLEAFASRENPLRANEAFRCVAGHSLPEAPEITLDEKTEVAQRYRSGNWVCRIRSSAQCGSCWLQNEQHESPMMWFVWRLRRTTDGVSGEAEILLLGDDSVVKAAAQRLTKWLESTGWHTRTLRDPSSGSPLVA